jgi:ElaB/YqjD/DUF883 family membrane-anchored ribosome-binding protein
MAILEAVESGHGRVVDLRHELDRVRDVLDRTDAVLDVADTAMLKAEDAIVTSRRVAPYVAVGMAVVVVAAVGVIVWRRRKRRDPLA